MRATNAAERIRPVPMIVALVVSTVGAVVHNMLEFPGMSLGAPEMLSVLIPAAVLSVWWLVRPNQAVWWTTAVWVALQLLVGAVITVLPLQFLPFAPEQSLGHYASHVAYGLAQLPAIYVLARSRNSSSPLAT